MITKSQIIALILILNFVALILCVSIIIKNSEVKRENSKQIINYQKISNQNNNLPTQYPKNNYSPYYSEGPAGGARSYCLGN